ncbi:MAG: hypothetical protein QW757_05145 [Candidatus Woesearchaeota archaeon]
MLYINEKPSNLSQIIEYQLYECVHSINKVTETIRIYSVNFYNKLLEIYKTSIENFILNLSYFYERYKTSLYNNGFVDLSFGALFSKKNQGTIKTPGNGHAGNSLGSGSKIPKSTPDKRKGGQNGPKQK